MFPWKFSQITGSVFELEGTTAPCLDQSESSPSHPWSFMCCVLERFAGVVSWGEKQTLGQSTALQLCKSSPRAYMCKLPTLVFMMFGNSFGSKRHGRRSVEEWTVVTVQLVQTPLTFTLGWLAIPGPHFMYIIWPGRKTCFQSVIHTFCNKWHF